MRSIHIYTILIDSNNTRTKEFLERVQLDKEQHRNAIYPYGILINGNYIRYHIFKCKAAEFTHCTHFDDNGNRIADYQWSFSTMVFKKEYNKDI